jgi:ESF2/ABP1 family protein
MSPDNLTEQIATETAERQARMRVEISKATRENKEFVRNIQKSKELDGIQSKAASKKNNDIETAEGGVAIAPRPEAKSLRKFNQASVGKKTPAKPSESVTRVLSQLL